MTTTAYRRGFTLIELLVVIAVIAVLAGGIGVAMLSGNPDKALQNSQSVAGSLTSVARSKAAIMQGDTGVFLNVAFGSDGFLREFRIATLNTSGDWVVSGDPVYLDKGIYFVPPSGSGFTTSQVEMVGTVAWNADLRSNGYSSASFPLNFSDSTNVPGSFRMVEAFNPRGGVIDFPTVVTPRTDRRIVLAPGRIESDGKITLNQAESVRGLMISTYGIAVMINDADAFKL